MLSQDDRRRLEQLERQLREDDPDFVARMSGRAPPRRSLATLLVCCLAWGLAAALALGGWWPAAVGAAVLAVIASVVVAYVTAT